MLDKILDEATNIMVFGLCLAVVVAFAASKLGLSLAVLIKFFSL